MEELFKYFTLSDGTEMEYIDMGGEGQVFMYVPGFGCAADFPCQLFSLLQDKFHCVSMTHRGFAPYDGIHKGTPATGQLGTAQAARDVKELIEYLGLEDIIILGYSMGGHIVFSYVEQFGCEHLAKVMIGDMTPKLVNDETWHHGLLQGHYTADRLKVDLELMQTDYPAFNRYFTCQASFPHTADEVRDYIFTEEMQKQLDDYAASFGIPEVTSDAIVYLPKEKWATYREYWKSMGEADFRGVLKDITVPAAIVHAVPGSIYDLGTAEYLCENIPDATRYPMEDCVHNTPNEVKIPEFAQIIREFGDK